MPLGLPRGCLLEGERLKRVKNRYESYFESFNVQNEELISEPNIGQEEGNDKIPFHRDRVIEDDKLGREPVAKAFVDLIKKDIFSSDFEHSFMVHLQGEWGTGKSSFLNLIKKNLSSENGKWIVVEYNAWQNQHLSPPWWTLIDQVYQQSKGQLKWYQTIMLILKENCRRIIRYSSWDKIMTFILALFFVIGLIMFGDSLFKFLIDSPESNIKVNNESKGLTISVMLKLMLTIGSGIGVIYSFSRFLSTPFFMKSVKDATSFMDRASDPMTSIKNHFEKLVNNINSKTDKRQLAIFIDDIDRCNREFIIELLEGIQTLFKEKKILYIVAGDKKWISTSFDETYKDFKTEQSAVKQNLGELFLEKAFQLSIRMPVVSEKAKERYWAHILGMPEEGLEKVEDVKELSSNEKEELKNKLSKENDITNPVFMDEIETEFNMSSDAVSNLIIETKNESSADLRHLLKDFHSLIDTNPRSIIRLANTYTMTRSTLIAEKKFFSPNKLFRWLTLLDLFSQIDIEVQKVGNLEDLKNDLLEGVNDRSKKEKCIILLFDKEDKYDGAFTLEEMKDFQGL